MLFREMSSKYEISKYCNCFIAYKANSFPFEVSDKYLQLKCCLKNRGLYSPILKRALAGQIETLRRLKLACVLYFAHPWSRWKPKYFTQHDTDTSILLIKTGGVCFLFVVNKICWDFISLTFTFQFLSHYSFWSKCSWRLALTIYYWVFMNC